MNDPSLRNEHFPIAKPSSKVPTEPTKSEGVAGQGEGQVWIVIGLLWGLFFVLFLGLLGLVGIGYQMYRQYAVQVEQEAIEKKHEAVEASARWNRTQAQVREAERAVDPTGLQNPKSENAGSLANSDSVVKTRIPVVPAPEAPPGGWRNSTEFRRAEMAMEQERKQREEETRKQNEKLAVPGNLSTIQRVLEAAIASRTSLDPDEPLLPFPGDNPGLSWRVYLLPYLGQQGLFNRFRLNEPWDSAHNHQLLERMPLIYGMSTDHTTRYRTCLPLDLPGPATNSLKFSDITDGINQTACFMYVGESKKIPWTKPDLEEFLGPLDVAHLGDSEEPTGLFTMFKSDQQYAASKYNNSIFSAVTTYKGGEHVTTLDQEPLQMQCWTPPRDSLTTARNADLSDPATRLKLNEKLKAISLAYVKYWQQEQEAPNHSVNVKLSWRVYLLPYLGYGDLFKKFDLDKPWNDPVNFSLIDQMPEVFEFDTTPGRTRFYCYGLCENGIEYSLSNMASVLVDAPETVTLIHYAGRQNAVTWTQPDYIFGHNPFLQKPSKLGDRLRWVLGWNASDVIETCTLDGTAISLPVDIHPTKLNAFLSVNGNEYFDSVKAMASHTNTIEFKPRIAPAGDITGMLVFPEVKVPAGGFPEPTAPEPTPANLAKVWSQLTIYTDRFGQTPGMVTRKDGSPSMLSWRVHLLPLIGYQTLYNKFNLEESWDSENNKTLLQYMPEVYVTNEQDKTVTSLQAFVGPESAMVGNGVRRRGRAMGDANVNTLRLMIVKNTAAVPWTAPDPHLVDRSSDLTDLIDPDKGMWVASSLGKYFLIPKQVPRELLYAFATTDGGDIFDAGRLQRWCAHIQGRPLVLESEKARHNAGQWQALGMAYMGYRDLAQKMSPPPGKELSMEQTMRMTQLSWRVHLLPYLGHTKLFLQFRVNEPWDSPHNKQLLNCMPDIYRDIDAGVDSVTTQFQLITGAGTMVPSTGSHLPARDVRDPLGSTITMIKVPIELAVPWTKPEDFAVSLNDNTTDKKIEDLVTGQGLEVLMADGGTQVMPPGTTLEKLKAMFTPNGGEIMQP